MSKKKSHCFLVLVGPIYIKVLVDPIFLYIQKTHTSVNLLSANHSRNKGFELLSCSKQKTIK
jgi:hypothetical protein